MLLQSPDTLPPPGFTPPHFPTLSLIWDAQHARDATLAKTLTLGSATVTLGHHDLESEDAQFPTALSWEMMDHEFGWDNEHGVCEVKVGQIEVERKAVTNGEYRAFLKKEGKSTIPGSWIEIDGEWMVCLVFFHLHRLPPQQMLTSYTWCLNITLGQVPLRPRRLRIRPALAADGLILRTRCLRRPQRWPSSHRG